MEVMKQLLLREHNKVFISDRAVMASEAAREVPDVHRHATMREVLFRTRHDEEFRKELSEGWVWVNHKGMYGSEFREIHNDGSVTEIDKKAYQQLPSERRALLKNGPGPMAVTFNADQESGGVVLDAIPAAMLTASVAIINDEFSKHTANEGMPKAERFKRHMRGAYPDTLSEI